MGKKVRLGIFHRNGLFGQCLAAALESSGRVQSRRLNHTEPSHVNDLEQGLFDAVLLDLSLEAFALELIARLQSHADQVKILLLIPPEKHEAIPKAIAAGAHGCVLEDVSLDALNDAIFCVLAGEFSCTPQIAREMLARLAQVSPRQIPQWQARAEAANLTQREFEIVYLIADGLSNKQIARRLSLSLYTVKNHVHSILQKLQASDRVDAVSQIRARGWAPKSSV
jgi:DNA-binding NarL/FixJ family response regulator